MIDPMFQPHRLFSRMTTTVRSANTLGFLALVVCLTACGDDTGENKDAKPPQSQTAAGNAADGGSAAGSKANTAGNEAAGSASSGTAGRAGAGTGGRVAAGGGKGGGPAAGAGAGNTAGASGGAAGASGAAGGAGGSNQPDPTVDVNVSEISASIAAAICDALNACVGPTKQAMLTGREDCVARYSASIEQDDFGSITESIKAGAIKLDESKLDACYSDTRALGCNVQAQRLPASCQAAIAGQRNVDDTCSLDADCVSAAYCPLDAMCPRSCEATHASGEACTRDAECQHGSICNASKCSVPAAEGEACAGDSGSLCALGLSCVGSDDVTPGICQTNASVQVGELDDACTPGGALCKEGLSCAYDGAAFKCVAAVASGATCQLSLPSQCPVETYCSAADLMQTGTCLALPTDGKACVLNNQCAGGNVCVTQAGTATCHKLGDLGDPCLANALCRSGACSNGTCVVRARCE